MATTDTNGILFYEDTDAVSPIHTLLNTGQQSVSDAISALDSDTGWLVCTAAVFSSSVVYARAVNGQVTIGGQWNPATNGTLTTSFVVVATLPSGTWPNSAQNTAMWVNTAMTLSCNISTTGVISIRTFSTAGTAYTTSNTFSLNGLTWRTD